MVVTFMMSPLYGSQSGTTAVAACERQSVDVHPANIGTGR